MGKRTARDAVLIVGMLAAIATTGQVFVWPLVAASSGCGVGPTAGQVPRTAASSAEYLWLFGSNGTGNGQFWSPYGIALNGSGDIFVADRQNDRVQVFNSNGQYKFMIGGGSGDGVIFDMPEGVAINSTGAIYVADTGMGRIQVFGPGGENITKWGTYGTGDGELSQPSKLAINASGQVYVVDTLNNRTQVFNASGEFLFKWGADGSGVGQFYRPSGIAINGSGYVYIADTMNDRIQVFSPTGQFICKWGTYGRTATGEFWNPAAITIDGSGRVYVADTLNSRIQVFSQTGQFLLLIGTNGGAPGEMCQPHGVAVNSTGHVFVVDTCSSRVEIFAVSWGGDLGEYWLWIVLSIMGVIVAGAFVYVNVYRKTPGAPPKTITPPPVEMNSGAESELDFSGSKKIPPEIPFDKPPVAHGGEAFSKLKKLVQVSRTLKIKQMAELLGITGAELNTHLVDWAVEFGFVLDQDIVDFTGCRREDFIAELDHAFASWTHKDKLA